MHKLKLFHQLICICGAIGMTSFCFYKFFQNKSVVSIELKEFHVTPRDIYPSFSVCFTNQRNDGIFKDTNGLKRKVVSDMMKGLAPLNESLLENQTYEDMTIKFPSGDIYYMIDKDGVGHKHICNMPYCFQTFGDAVTKCFTHDIKFEQNTKIIKLDMTLRNLSSLIVEESVLNVYIHHPGQLFRSSLQPIFFRKRTSRHKNYVLLRIQSVSVVRNREDGKEGCNPANFEDDRIILEKSARMFSCKSKYPGQ